MHFNFHIEDIKYIKILYRDETNHPKIIQAALRKIDNDKLHACIKYKQEISLEVPQEVVLSIVCGDGLYRTKTILRKYENDPPYAYLTLDLPQNIEYQQNREYFRIIANLPCKYICQIKNEIKEYQTTTYDISANGVSIILPELAVTDGSSKLDITIAGQEITLETQYIRSEKTDNHYKISLSFTNISNRDRDIIAQACIKQQLAEKRKYIN